MEAKWSLETSVDFQRGVRNYIAEEKTKIINKHRQMKEV
jgi:hypothetical protein